MLGVGSIYDSTIGDGNIPECYELGRSNPLRELAKHNTTSHVKLDSELTSEEYWEDLQPTINILSKVAPHVEVWLKKKYEEGSVKFDNSSNLEFNATYDCISKELTIYHSFFFQDDGIKASVLAHEWRHSRQNHHKHMKYIISYVLTRELKDDIIENDAYLYERSVYLAIYGDHRDNFGSESHKDLKELDEKE